MWSLEGFLVATIEDLHVLRYNGDQGLLSYLGFYDPPKACLVLEDILAPASDWWGPWAPRALWVTLGCSLLLSARSHIILHSVFTTALDLLPNCIPPTLN